MEYLIQNVQVIDGLLDEGQQHMDVFIRDGLIETVAPSGTIEWEVPASSLVDGRGRTLLPGLIDCHVHYSLNPATQDFNESVAQSDLDVSVTLVEQAKNALSAGITSARSAGAPRNLDFWLRDTIVSGRLPGPRLTAAGLAIGCTGGHGYKFGIEADSELELLKAVRQQVRDGADVIKIIASEAAMLTTTGLSPGRTVFGNDELTEREIKVVVDEAHRLGRKVLAHAQGSSSVMNAARAGADSIEHAFLADEFALDVLAESGATLVPTLLVTAINVGLGGLTPVQRARQETIEELHRTSCENAIERGIPIATGTDTGEPGVFSNALFREVQLLVDHGYSAMQALKSATSVGATLLGVDDHLGTIEKGKVADVVLVNGDPLTDLSVLQSPLMVFLGGVVQEVSASAQGQATATNTINGP